jgi:hypothetical protein
MTEENVVSLLATEPLYGESMNTDLVVQHRAGLGSGWMDAAMLVLWGGVQLAFGLAFMTQPAAETTGSAVARCDHMAQIVSSRKRAAPDAQWRREREGAFNACLEGPDDYARSQGIQ